MKAHQIAERVKEAILSGKYDVIRCNFPNPDMVGHTGKLQACIAGCTAADEGVTVGDGDEEGGSSGRGVGLDVRGAGLRGTDSTFVLVSSCF